MIRTLSLTGTLHKLCGELALRLHQSAWAEWKGHLSISDPRETVYLKIDAGVEVGKQVKTEHFIHGGEEIAQLLIGSDEPQAIIAANKMQLGGQAKQLAEVMFPSRHPMLPVWDWF